MIGSVTVFCGSIDAVDAKYFAAAAELGEKIERRGWRIIYGGGASGSWGRWRAQRSARAATSPG